MSSPFDFFWKEDPLKAAQQLIEKSNFSTKRKDDKEIPVNTSLLFLTSIFLALSKSFYGGAGFSFTQHLITSVVLIFVGYIAIGIFLIPWKPYEWVNNVLRCFLTCFIAALTVSLFLIYFSEPITDGGIFLVETFTTSEWLANRLPNAAPAALFSLIGCIAIYSVKHRTNKQRTTKIEIGVFAFYWFVTTVIFFFVAYDRGWFFDNVMKHISKLKLF